MDELGQAAVLLGRSDRGEPPLEEVLDRLDVVLGDPLDLAHLGDLLGTEVVDDLAQRPLLAVRQRAHTGHDLVGREVDQPLDLDPHALAVQRRLGEVLDEWCDGGAVAAVEGAEGEGESRQQARP